MDKLSVTRTKIYIIIGLAFSLLSACTLPSPEIQAGNPENPDQGSQPQHSKTPIPIPASTSTFTPPPATTTSPPPTNTLTPSATPTATIAGVLHFNNFDLFENSGPISNFEGTTKEFKDGELIVVVQLPSNYYSLEIYEQEMTAAQLTAWVKFEGDPESSIGYYCQNYQDKNDIFFRYQFLISRNGEFSLEYLSVDQDMDNTRIELLGEGTTSALYPQGSEMYNSLQAFCENDHLLFFVNGELLIDVFTTRPVIAGTVGLITGNTQDSDYVQAIWDMVTVSEP